MKRIESAQNALVKQWKKLVTKRKERDTAEQFIVEGFHLVEEALNEKGTVLHVMIGEGVQVPAHWNLENIQQIEISSAIVRELAETENTQGIFAHCKQQAITNEKKNEWQKLLFIDAVQDPGNIGTMIRTADAAGVDVVVLGKGCADPYNPKTLRAAQGAHFHIPIIRGEIEEWIAFAESKTIPVFGTGFERAVSHYEIGPQEHFALIVGNEGSGVAEQYLQASNKVVKIPLYGRAESLNVAVAAGILLYTFCKRS